MSLHLSPIPTRLGVGTTIVKQRTQVSERATLDWLALDRIALLGCLLVGLFVGIAQATGFITDPYDARFYWEAHPQNLYLPQWTGGYVYPPPMALLLTVFHPVGWPLFIVAFTTATWAAFWYCTRALAPLIILVSLALVPIIGGNVIGYLFIGNVQMIMAAAIVASVRLSAAWAVVPLLTKGIGVSLVWFAARREWRNLGLALGLTTAIIAVTFVVAPNAWLDFAVFLSTNSLADPPLPLVPIAFPLRLAAAVGLVAWGGFTDRRWTVPIAAGLALPALYLWSYLSLWVGVIGIEWARHERKPTPPWSVPLWLGKTATPPPSRVSNHPGVDV